VRQRFPGLINVSVLGLPYLQINIVRFKVIVFLSLFTRPSWKHSYLSI